MPSACSGVGQYCGEHLMLQWRGRPAMPATYFKCVARYPNRVVCSGAPLCGRQQVREAPSAANPGQSDGGGCAAVQKRGSHAVIHLFHLN